MSRAKITNSAVGSMAARSLATSALVLLTTVITGCAAAQPVDIHQVGWLQGCWELVSATSTVEEQWMAPRGDNMIGMSRTVRDGSLGGFELVVIREQDDRLAYEARPSGQPAAVFLSGTVNDSTVVFENPEHDFPQRIGYDRVVPDSLIGWISGAANGVERRIDFPYGRVPCADIR